MGVRVNVKYIPEGDDALEIRTLLCRVSSDEPSQQNPLTDTNFNDLLDKIAQTAFDEGRQFEKQN